MVYSREMVVFLLSFIHHNNENFSSETPNIHPKGTHLIKKVPFSAIKFLSYERYKQVTVCYSMHGLSNQQQLLTPARQEDARVWRRFVAGGAAALTAVFCTYPLDLVQTQLTGKNNNKQKSTFF